MLIIGARVLATVALISVPVFGVATSTAAENSPATNGFSSSVSTASAGVPLH